MPVVIVPQTTISSANLSSLISQGQVFYLKGKVPISGQVIGTYDIDLGALGHPVLILKLDIDREHARVCTVSLFGFQLAVRKCG